MHRRRLLASAVGAAGALAGCTARVPFGSETVPEREHPERPNALDSESVVDYVTEYEAVRAHNALRGEDVTEVNLSAEAVLEYEAAGGYHLSARHAGSVYSRHDGNESVGEVYSDRVPYRVTAEETRRASVSQESVEDPLTPEPDENGGEAESGDEAENGDGGSGEAENGDGGSGEAENGDGETGDGGDGGEAVDAPLDIRLVNFADETATIDLSVEHDGEPIHESTRALDADEAVVVADLAAVAGEYRVVAAVELGEITGNARISMTLPDVERGPNVEVAVTNDGTVARGLSGAALI